MNRWTMGSLKVALEVSVCLNLSGFFLFPFPTSSINYPTLSCLVLLWALLPGSYKALLQPMLLQTLSTSYPSSSARERLPTVESPMLGIKPGVFGWLSARSASVLCIPSPPLSLSFSLFLGRSLCYLSMRPALGSRGF